MAAPALPGCVRAINNNAAERAVRPKRATFAAGPLVLGRKNRLFAGSDAGGNRAAAVASLLETAKLNGINPAACLRHVPGTIANHPVSRVAELPPQAGTGLPTRLNQTQPRLRPDAYDQPAKDWFVLVQSWTPACS